MEKGLEFLIDYNEDRSSDVGNSQEATIFIETLGTDKSSNFFLNMKFNSTCSIEWRRDLPAFICEKS